MYSHSRYIYVHILAVYAQLLSQLCTLSAYHIRIDHPSNTQSMFSNQYQPNDHNSNSNNNNNRFKTDPFGSIEDMRRNRQNAWSRQTKTMPSNDMAFNSKPDPFVDNHFFDDFRKELPNENKFHKQSKEVRKFHTHVSRIDENSNDGPPKTDTDHHIYSNNNHQRKQTATVDSDGFDKNVDFKFVSDFPSERLIKSDDFFSPKRIQTTTTPTTDKPRKLKKSFDYEDTIGDINMNNKHTDEPDELKTEVTNRDDVLRYHSNNMNELKSRLNHISTDPNYYHQHNSDISHDNNGDRTPIYDDNQPKNFEDRFSLDPRTHINKMLNYFNAYPSTALIDHNANTDPHPNPNPNPNRKRNDNTHRQHIYHYHPQTNADHNNENDNRFNSFDSQRQNYNSDINHQQNNNQKKRADREEFAPWVREITTIIPSDDQSFLFKPIDEPSAPALPDIDLFIKRHNDNNRRKKSRSAGKLKKDESFYDDFDELPKHSDDEQTKKQVENELNKALPISQYTAHDDTQTDDKNAHNNGESTAKPTNFEQEVDISSDDLEKYFDKEFSNFHSDKDSMDDKPDAEVENDDTPVQPTRIPTHVYRDHEQENDDLTPEPQPKLLINPVVIEKSRNNDPNDNEGSRRSAKAEQELDEREPDYRTSADFMKDHDDFLKKIDFENEKFKKESDDKSAKQQQEDSDNEQEEENENNDNEAENKKQVDDGERELDNDDSDNKRDNDNDDSDDTAEDSKVKQKKAQEKQENNEESDKEEENSDAKEDDNRKNAADNEDDETEETKEEVVENDSVKTDDNDNDSDDNSKADDTDASKKSVVKDVKKPVKQNERKAVIDLVKSIKQKNVICDDLDKCDDKRDKLNDIAETKEFRESIPVVPKAPKVPVNLPKKVLFLQTSIISTDSPKTRNEQRLLETETNTISTPITTQIAVPLTVTASNRRINRNLDANGVTSTPLTIDLKRINTKTVAHYSPKKF